MLLMSVCSFVYMFVFSPPSVRFSSLLFVSVVSSVAHQLDIGLLVVLFLLSALRLYRPLVFLPSFCSSCDILMFVHQLAISYLVGLFIPANNNLVLGTRPAPRAHVLASFFFSVCPSLLSVPSLCVRVFSLPSSFFECTYS